MPRLLVTDANILIDLAIAKSAQLLFIDGYRVVVSVDVFYEINPDQMDYWRPLVDAGRLHLEEADEDIVDHLRTQHSTSLSDPDLTFFALLTKGNCIALSGDQKLVKACRKAGHEAHGLLWLLDQHAQDKANFSTLHSALSVIMDHNSRLPVKECSHRLTFWKG